MSDEIDTNRQFQVFEFSLSEVTFTQLIHLRIVLRVSFN
jgi:hypothetical protein